MASNENNMSTLPTLASLCIKVIAEKIDKINAVRLGVLSEYEWESIVKYKCQMMSKASGKGNATRKSQLSKLPAISERVVKEIEGKNPHLRSSKVVDELIWKDCADYLFPRDGISRPIILYLPWPNLVENYKKIGIILLGLLKKPCDGEANDSLKRTKKLENCIKMLRDAPMCVPLLSQSGVGKSVGKFVRSSRKIFQKGMSLEECEVPDYFPKLCCARWPPQRAVNYHHSDRHSSSQKDLNLSTSLAVLENLLLGWKSVAQEKGVKINETQRSRDPSNQYTGRANTTSERQHERDIENAQKCTEWRKLHAILIKRKEKMTVTNSARYKKNRDLECSNKLTTAKTNTKKRSAGWDKGQNTSSGGGSKLKEMRQGLKDANKVMKSMATSGVKHETSAFGAAVAGSKINKNKKPQWDGQARGLKRSSNLIFGNGISKRDITLGGGKKLKLPRTSRNS